MHERLRPPAICREPDSLAPPRRVPSEMLRPLSPGGYLAGAPLRRSRTTTSTRAISKPSGGTGRSPSTTSAAGDVEQRMLAGKEEVVMLGRVGVEKRLRSVDGDLPDQAGLGELMQIVVDGRKRHRDPRRDRLSMQHLGGEMPIAVRKQDRAQRQTLACRAQTGAAKQLLIIGTAGRRAPARWHPSSRSGPAASAPSRPEKPMVSNCAILELHRGDGADDPANAHDAASVSARLRRALARRLSPLSSPKQRSKSRQLVHTGVLHITKPSLSHSMR